MRVLAVADRLSSGWYRVRQPIEALASEAGVDVTVVERLPFVDGRWDVRSIRGLEYADCDVLVLLRPTSSWAPDMIRQVQARGVRVVVDIDDDFHAVHALNRAFDEHHPRLQPHGNWHHFRNAARLADLVTVSTPALARRYGAHGRVAVLRNCPTASWLTIPRKGDGRTVGWAGALTNHPTDLEVTHGGVARAVADNAARFLCVGGGYRHDQIARQLGLDRMDSTVWKDLELHPYLVARLDVGIAPLADTKFNSAKSALKGLEYAALGVPFVASPVAEYRRLHDRYGLGLLAANRGRAWRREVGRLLRDEALRVELGERARSVVADHLAIDRNAWRWAEAWESVLAQGRRAA